MTDFAKLEGEVLGLKELDEIIDVLHGRTDEEPTVQELAKALLAMNAGYVALLNRVRLAELALNRTRLIADDVQALCLKPKEKPGKEWFLRILKEYVEHYVDPVQADLLKALGVEGDVSPGWYVDAESARAQLVGSKRAMERLSRERPSPGQVKEWMGDPQIGGSLDALDGHVRISDDELPAMLSDEPRAPGGGESE